MIASILSSSVGEASVAMDADADAWGAAVAGAAVAVGSARVATFTWGVFVGGDVVVALALSEAASAAGSAVGATSSSPSGVYTPPSSYS